MDRERFKQWAIGWRDPLYTLLLLLGSVAAATLTVVIIVGAFHLIPAIKDWRHANTATTKVYEESLSELNSAIKEVGPTLKGLQADEEALKKYVGTLDEGTAKLFASLDGRLATLDGVLVSLRGVSDEGRAQVKQIGDATRDSVLSLNDLIRNTDTRVSKLLGDGSLMIETLNPKLATMLEHTDALIVDADGTIKAYKPLAGDLSVIAKEVQGMATDGHAMTSDIKGKLHEVLYPPKVKGFWPNVKRVASFLYQPAYDGVRIYYTLRSLPIRVTEPIPSPQ